MSRMESSNPIEGQQEGASLRDSARQVQEDLRQVGSQVRDTAQEQYERLREQAGEYYEQGRQRAMEFEQNLEDYVREQPLKSLLIAAGVGMLLGILWKRS